MIVRDATRDDAPAIAKVHVDTWRTTYQGIVPDEHLARLSYEHRTDRWHQILNCTLEDGNFTYVAEQGSGEILGFANGGLERTGDPVYKVELAAIYILKNHQGTGIGRCLVRAVAERLGQLGVDSMLVWVLIENPAYQFYAALGGTLVHEKELDIGGKSLIEVAYGWTDITHLRSVIGSVRNSVFEPESPDGKKRDLI